MKPRNLNENLKMLWALATLLAIPASGGAADLVEAVGLGHSTVGICRTTVATNLTLDLSTGAGILTTSDEYFCSLGSRGNEVFPPGSCRGTKTGTVRCYASGSLGGEEWISRLTLSPRGQLVFTKRSVDRSPWGVHTQVYRLRGSLIRF